VGDVTVREAIALSGACVWGPALFLVFMPAWLWALLAGAAGLVMGFVAGWACGWLLWRSDGAGCGLQFLAVASLFALPAPPLVVLWLLRGPR
jgi:hypothetical protein